MGLCYQTTRWLDRLWGEHLELSQPARDLVQVGIGRQGDRFAGFPADLHARLYLPSDPAVTDNAPSWGTHLHSLANDLSEWNRLKVMTSRNGFAAGIATEVLLQELLPHVPARSPERPGARPATPPDPSHGENPRPTQKEGSRAPAHSGEGPGQGHGCENQNDDSQLRASLRRAVRAARTAVQQAEAGLEGLATPLCLRAPGTPIVPHAGPANLGAVRDAHARISKSRRLQRIAELAGRLERIAAAKTRSKVKPGVGEIHGIGLGGFPDLARLLPSELVALRRRPLRLHLLSRLFQQKALVYAMTGREPQSRGPIVVLLDESGSMREAGKDIWSKAVALALLSTATKQRRAWYLVGFNGAVVREQTIPTGKATAADIQQALDHGCSGGTDFDAPVLRAIEIVRMSSTMKQADVVVVTDGEDELEPATVEKARELTRSEGVSWFAVGVGQDAEAALQSLSQIATSMVRVRCTEDADDLIAPVINLDTEQ